MVADRSDIRRRTRAPTAALALLLCPPPPAAAAAQPRKQAVPAPPLAPDFAAIITRIEAAKLVRKHVLVRIHFVPTELGGPKARANIGYVTPRAAAQHAQLVEMLVAYRERGRLDQLTIAPTYKGDSVIPSRIRMTASHSRTGESYERVIEVWDCRRCPPPDPLPDPHAPGEVMA